MDAGDQHFLVVGAVEDTDLAALGQVAGGAPQKIMRQFGRAGMLEAEDLAALRVHPRHDMADHAILARRVHRLEDHQQGIFVRGIEALLQFVQPRHMGSELFLIVVHRCIDRLDAGRPFAQIDFVAGAEIAGMDFHEKSFSRMAGWHKGQ
jgi:DNA-directed RNA polymerase specialized sigma24 family protein